MSAGSARRRALLIVNPKARNGGTPPDALRAALTEGGLDLVEPAPDTPCAEAIAAEAGRAELVILGGGDGTMNAAAPALVATGLPLAILPLGTANDLARSLGKAWQGRAAGWAGREQISAVLDMLAAIPDATILPGHAQQSSAAFTADMSLGFGPWGC